MSNGSTTVPVIAGLAVGIAFIATFSVLGFPMQQRVDSTQQPVAEEVFIDFSVTLAEQDIVVKKGQTVKVPILIESGKETEKVLSLSIIARGDVPDSSELQLSLDKDSVVLSKSDINEQQATGSGDLIIRDGGFLTVTASPTAKAGTYEYGLEASYEDASGGMGAGQLFRVTIVE